MERIIDSLLQIFFVSNLRSVILISFCALPHRLVWFGLVWFGSVRIKPIEVLIIETFRFF